MAESTYTVTRSITIAAPPQKVYDLVADFHQWPLWSPWEEIDPEMQRTYGGPDAGVGATYAWSGNKKAGRGRMEITEATPAERIAIALTFEKPFKSSNTTTFAFTPEGEGTNVDWTMIGPRPLIMRIFSFVFNLEKLVGGDFTKGLVKLRTAAEA